MNLSNCNFNNFKFINTTFSSTGAYLKELKASRPTLMNYFGRVIEFGS